MIGRKYSSRQRQFQADIVAVTLSCDKALDEIYEIEDGKRLFSDDCKYLQKFRDSLAYYLNPQIYDGKNSLNNLFFRSYMEGVFLDKFFSKSFKESKKDILETISNLSLLGNLQKSARFFICLMEEGLVAYRFPPSDVPNSVREFARSLVKK